MGNVIHYEGKINEIQEYTTHRVFLLCKQNWTVKPIKICGWKSNQ